MIFSELQSNNYVQIIHIIIFQCICMFVDVLCQRQFHFGAGPFAIAPAPSESPRPPWYLVLMVKHLYLSFNVQAMYIFGSSASFWLVLVRCHCCRCPARLHALDDGFSNYVWH